MATNSTSRSPAVSPISSKTPTPIPPSRGRRWCARSRHWWWEAASAACWRSARLRAAGVEDLCIIEKGGDFGGTWYWNRYPGAACDTESYIYLPLLEETGYMPSEKYAARPRSWSSAAHRPAVRPVPAALFQTEVTDMLAGTTPRPLGHQHRPRDDALRARLRRAWPAGRCMCPSCRASRGVDSFKGHTFHTSRWDYAYTGGDSRRAHR
jgi:cyclohexanone monooxygenase